MDATPKSFQTITSLNSAKRLGQIPVSSTNISERTEKAAKNSHPASARRSTEYRVVINQREWFRPPPTTAAPAAAAADAETAGNESAIARGDLRDTHDAVGCACVWLTDRTRRNRCNATSTAGFVDYGRTATYTQRQTVGQQSVILRICRHQCLTTLE